MGTSTNSPLFGPRRDPWLSKWNTLFDSNPKEWISFKPAVGLNVFPCYACRHMFSSHKSFKDHINRRAVLLKYDCPDCSHLTPSPYTFLNRCSLLLHARKHFTLQQGAINLNNIEVDILPLELAGFQPNPEIPIIYGEEETLVDSNVYINAQFYAPRNEDKGKEVIILMPNDLVINKTGEETQLALKQLCRNLPFCHFITLDEQKKLRSQNMLVEVKSEPSDGSDSGGGNEITLPVISKIESLQGIRRCIECNLQIDCTMPEHFLGENRPKEDRLKCNVCRYVAPTECSLSAHERIHENLPPFVCPECGEEFSHDLKLQKHMDEVCFHMAKNVKFRCPGKKCGKLFAASQTYAAHFAVHMKVMYKCDICREVRETVDSIIAHGRDHVNMITSYEKIFDCTVCCFHFFNDEKCQKHIQWHSTDRSKCVYVYLCRHCKNFFRSTQTYSLHLFKCSKNNTNKEKAQKDQFGSKYLSGECLMCKNKIIYTKEKEVKVCSRCKPHYIENKMNDRCFCILCKKQIPLKERKPHQKQCRYSHPRVVLNKLQISQEKTFSSSTSSSDMEGSPSKRRSGDRKKSKPYRAKKSSEIEFDLTADEPIRFNGTYRCVLCGFVEESREKFHEHIKSHRDISTSFQCMECGECFVVKPSLMKHLMHFHNISDLERYFQENDCFDVGAVKELAEVVKLAPYIAKEMVKENQCKVCLEEFENKDDLDVHFRKHGMAFLARNSL